MTKDDIIKLARQAGGTAYVNRHYPGETAMAFSNGPLLKFATLVAQADREASQAAQAENEQLKAQIARSGVELRSAVLAEREECAKVVEGLCNQATKWPDAFEGATAETKFIRGIGAAMDKTFSKAIRARNHVEQPLPMVACTDCDCADNEPCSKTDWSAA